MLTPLAHAGRPPAPHDVWTAWNLDPLLLAALVLVGAVHLRGRRRPTTATGRRRDRAFTGAWLALVVAFVSPLEAMSSALASAHMVQHVLIVLVAAPLLAVAAPSATLLRGLPAGVARATVAVRRGVFAGIGRAITTPVVAWVVHVATLWGWHAAGPYDAALADPLLHAVEHLMFLVTGFLVWAAVVGPHRAHGSNGAGVLVVFALALQGVLLSALLTFAGAPWYDGYATTTAAWGLAHLDDQHLAGVIMWLPGGLVHVGTGLGLFVAWVSSTESADDGTTAMAPPVRRAS